MFVRFDPVSESKYDNNSMSQRDSKSKIKLARAYVPNQPYIGLFPLDEALRKGTIFPNLAMPFPYKKKRGEENV